MARPESVRRSRQIKQIWIDKKKQIYFFIFRDVGIFFAGSVSCSSEVRSHRTHSPFRMKHQRCRCLGGITISHTQQQTAAVIPFCTARVGIKRGTWNGMERGMEYGMKRQTA